MSPDRGISRFRIKNSIPPPPCGEVDARSAASTSGGGTPEQRAKALRKNMTVAERILWAALRQFKSVGLHFRRQAPFDNYILDFACHNAKLVVEVDGSQHAMPKAIEHDEKRTTFLKSRGYFVLRFWNVDVITNRDGVSDTIYAVAKTPHHQRAALLKSNSPPPPPCGEVEIARAISGGGPPPDVLASLRASTSPQGGGGGEVAS
jgi:very-short-patch-repair endonuclease